MVMLLLILQRYEFSSKSQRLSPEVSVKWCCCWYYKGTNFQANHNRCTNGSLILTVVADTTKVRIFKQITTAKQLSWQLCKLLLILQRYEFSSKSQHVVLVYVFAFGCCWYYKGTNFQANHNKNKTTKHHWIVVADTTKVRIFKQITTQYRIQLEKYGLLLILQRYEFSSKSQQLFKVKY